MSKEAPIGDYAKQLLAKGKPKQNRNGSASFAQAPTGGAAKVGVNKRYYHPQVYDKISTHIAERLKKLGG